MSRYVTTPMLQRDVSWKVYHKWKSETCVRGQIINQENLQVIASGIKYRWLSDKSQYFIVRKVNENLFFTSLMQPKVTITWKASSAIDIWRMLMLLWHYDNVFSSNIINENFFTPRKSIDLSRNKSKILRYKY